MFRAGEVESLSLILRTHVEKPRVVVFPVTLAQGSGSAPVTLTWAQRQVHLWAPCPATLPHYGASPRVVRDLVSRRKRRKRVISNYAQSCSSSFPQLIVPTNIHISIHRMSLL